ncbi:hypothetical protein X773_31040 [Mesorhizobium sp. LSJC285A00]|nr:hypothetical protein X773_31040 [Mesorhizobium sp. LSJC285A00]
MGGTFRQVAFRVHDGTSISLFEVKVTCEVTRAGHSDARLLEA